MSVGVLRGETRGSGALLTGSWGVNMMPMMAKMKLKMAKMTPEMAKMRVNTHDDGQDG